MNRGLATLSVDDCLRQLSIGTVGRIAFIVDDLPVVLPVNYRVVDLGREPAILIRTRPGSEIDRAPFNVAFEIDGIDPTHRTGWSVLVRGVVRHLRDAEAHQLEERFDPGPWAGGDRSSWMLVAPLEITGRRLVEPDDTWTYERRAYL
jgi:nitroimidazol reductase NimA-like FMN-containing flavoprotein (pyridoxamine 5'-phosphate oxidase superfamily)